MTMMQHKLTPQLHICVTDMNCLRLNEVRIPMHTVRDQNARLECHFDLEGEALYSVKWYKDGNEFFRYVPRDQPPAQLFPLPGVTVDVSIQSKFAINYSTDVCHLFQEDRH